MQTHGMLSALLRKDPARPPLPSLPGALQPPLAGDTSYTGRLTSRATRWPRSDRPMARTGLAASSWDIHTFLHYSAVAAPHP